MIYKSEKFAASVQANLPIFGIELKKHTLSAAMCQFFENHKKCWITQHCITCPRITVFQSSMLILSYTYFLFGYVLGLIDSNEIPVLHNSIFCIKTYVHCTYAIVVYSLSINGFIWTISKYNIITIGWWHSNTGY